MEDCASSGNASNGTQLVEYRPSIFDQMKRMENPKSLSQTLPSSSQHPTHSTLGKTHTNNGTIAEKENTHKEEEKLRVKKPHHLDPRLKTFMLRRVKETPSEPNPDEDMDQPLSNANKSICNTSESNPITAAFVHDKTTITEPFVHDKTTVRVAEPFVHDKTTVAEPFDAVPDPVGTCNQEDIIFYDKHAGHKIEIKEEIYHVIKIQDVVVVL